MNKYFWNFDEHDEVWRNSGDTIEECISEAKWEKEYREMAEDYVYIGEIEAHEPEIDIEYLIDNIQEQAYEECGESCEGWLDGLKKEDMKKLEERLNKVFADWLEETKNQPYFGNFAKVSKYNLETGKESEDN